MGIGSGFKVLIGLGGALFALSILLSMAADITEEVQSGVACPTGFTYTMNASVPGGTCCDTDTPADCLGITANGTHGESAFTTAGNTTVQGQEGMMRMSSQFPNVGTIAAVMAIIAVITGLLFLVRRR